MDFQLNEDQVAMRDMARDFAAEKLKPHAVEWDQTKHFPMDVLREAAALGLGAINVSGAHGGSGLSRTEGVLIYEALASGCPSLTGYLSVHNMVAAMIDRFGSPAQCQRYLPDLVSMETFASYCLTEPGSGSDAAALRTRARRDGSYYVLDGQKQFISGAGSSGIYVVMARTGADGPKGISAFIVEEGMKGLGFGANERKMGWNAQPTRAVIMEGVRVPEANRLGEEGAGFSIAMSGLDSGRLSIAACSLGGAQTAFDIAKSYVGERKAFGQKLNQFQNVQFQLADMATELEAARLLLWRAADSYDRKDPNLTLHCAHAKRFVTDTGFSVANRALQLLGGYGYLADYGIEKIVRDLRVHQILEGANDIMRLIIGRSMLS
ncbi:MAG: acyl-CoA dehydrogenase family protein [Hyphomicrobiales bacterium]|nr:acyl-CoA dehydrogenase family protein [Hyphomicrobiales bacterium]